MKKLVNFVMSVLVAFMLAGCSSVLSTEQVVSRIDVMLKSESKELQRYEEIKQRQDQVLLMVTMMYFIGAIPQDKLSEFVQLDAVHYYLSLAHVKLIENEEAAAGKFMDMAEAIQKDVVSKLDKLEVPKVSKLGQEV